MPPNYRNTCQCACGCGRRCAIPYEYCSYCVVGAHRLPPEQRVAVLLGNSNAIDRDRTNCEDCGRPGEWYEFQPGTGRCEVCMS